MDRYRAWLIDLDGTLYNAGLVRAAMAFELALCGTSSIPVLKRFRAEHEVIRRQPAESHPSPFEQQIFRTAHYFRLEKETVQNTIECWMFDRPQKWVSMFRRRPLLQSIIDFRAAGGRTALVSDYPAEKKLRAIDMVQHFDVVIANGHADGPLRPKPWPDGFLLSAQRLGIGVEHCLAIGDRLDTDGAAARQAGIDFVHVRDFVKARKG